MEPDSNKVLNEEETTTAEESSTVVSPVDITPEKKGGVTKVIVLEGAGDSPGYGDKVTIRYEGSMIVGGKIIPHEKDVTQFHVGKEEIIIKGLDLAVSTMRKGEISTFFINDPQYSYGRTGSYPPQVPPNTPVMFYVELLDWQLEDLSPKKDGSILRKVLERGESTIVPNEGSKMSIRLVGKFKGEIFENSIRDFILGEGCCHCIPIGVEIALYKFQRSEKSVIHLKDKYGLQTGIEELGIPANSPVSYEVKLLAFERVKEIWEMNSDEKYEKAKSSRERGIEFVSAGNFKVAWMHFKWIILCLEKEPGVDPQTVQIRNNLLLSGYLNVALCLLKLGKNNETIKFCDKALQMDPDNEKALFRRGMANFSNKDYEDALTDFKRIAYLYPENKSAKKCILQCKEDIKKHQLQDKSVYNKMFDKFVKQDEERIKKMKTETGVWENENEVIMGEKVAEQHALSETERLIQENDSVLRDANIIELSNNLSGKF